MKFWRAIRAAGQIDLFLMTTWPAARARFLEILENEPEDSPLRELFRLADSLWRKFRG